MNKFFRYFLVIFVMGVSWMMAAHGASADENGSMTVSVAPVKYVSVKGDVNKFQAMKWMNDGYSGGISHLSFDQELKGGATVSFEGHMIPYENDMSGDLLFRKGDDAFIKTKYQSFRKYYDRTGGVYNAFTTLRVNELQNQQDLQLDISNFMFEAGLGPLNDPNLSLMYERRTKDGAKSLINWAPVKEGATTRKTGPVLEQMEQTSDVIALKGKVDVAGMTVKGEQKAEFDHIYNLQTKEYLNGSTTPSTDNKIRQQEQRPNTAIYSTALRGEKWTTNDNTFFGLGYHFFHINSGVVEQLREYNRNYVLTNYSSTSSRQTLPSSSESNVDEHIWTGDMHTNLTPNLIFISKAKVEIKGQKSNAIFLLDSSPGASSGASHPNGIVDRTDQGTVENKVNSVGENLSLRYDGIAHTSLYTEVEMEQSRDAVSKEYTSTTVANSFSEAKLNHNQKTSWTVGGRVIPSQYLTITTQVRQRFQNTDFDNINHGGPGSAVDLLDSLQIRRDEAETKLTWKPCRWLQNGFRFQFGNVMFFPRAEGQVETKNQGLDYVYTYDISVQPIDPLLFMIAFSREQLAVKTLAGSSSSSPTKMFPGFNSDVNSWLFSASYAPVEQVVMTNTVSYSLADNFQNLGTNLLSLGADFKELNLSTSLAWSPKKDLTIKPIYEYASYTENPLSGLNNYSAHIFALDVSLNW